MLIAELLKPFIPKKRRRNTSAARRASLLNHRVTRSSGFDRRRLEGKRGEIHCEEFVTPPRKSSRDTETKCLPPTNTQLREENGTAAAKGSKVTCDASVGTTGTKIRTVGVSTEDLDSFTEGEKKLTSIPNNEPQEPAKTEATAEPTASSSSDRELEREKKIIILELKAKKLLVMVKHYKTKYEEANEKVINMEGLVKLNTSGSIVKELEMKVAMYKCQLSEAAEEKDDLVDSYESKVEDLEAEIQRLKAVTIDA